MKIKPVYNVHIDENDIHGSVERLADSLTNSVSSIALSQIIAGNLIQNISLGTTAKRVEHKLERKPLGYIVVNQDANAVIYRQTDSMDNKFLSLVASAPVNVSLWVF